jgi:endonuclease III
MATTTNKQKLVNQLFTALGKSFRAGEPTQRPVLEQFIYAVCREGVTREQADKAFHALQGRFFDWNEIRVSSVHELADALAELNDAEVRAQRIIDFLQEVFETTFSFDLESLQKKGLKQAAKQLARYQAANDYAAAWVIQQSLGGHAIPLDGPALRVLRRLGLLEDEGTDMEALRGCIEHQIPKARGQVFVDLISTFAEEVCFEMDPACPACPLQHYCPIGQEYKGMATATRQKPR